MAKKYDLIVVGGGPGGLMAAKTAAEDGLSVLLVERKKNITEINRACCQNFYVHKMNALPGAESESGGPYGDGYIDPVSVEIGAEKTIFHFHVPGFSLEYTGTLRPFLNWINISPSGNQINVYKTNDKPWAYYYDKEAFVAQLLASAEKAGAEVWSEAAGLAAENTRDGVKVRINRKSGEETLEARAAIAADGLPSKIVDSVGLNQKRMLASSSAQLKFLHYVIEGMETGFPDSSWLCWNIPSINPFGFPGLGAACMYQWIDNMNTMGTLTVGETSPESVLDNFMKHPRWSGMFRRARIVKKQAFVISGAMYGPIREPIAGNVVAVGDAAAPIETWIQGAVACSYQAVKAIEKELNGQKGYPDYIAWWQQAFAFNTPYYLDRVSKGFTAPLSMIVNDEEMDYIFSLFQGRPGIPEMMIAKNLEQIKGERPELGEKLTKLAESLSL
jgi:flavin-dependent dehydrogenase